MELNSDWHWANSLAGIIISFWKQARISEHGSNYFNWEDPSCSLLPEALISQFGCYIRIKDNSHVVVIYRNLGNLQSETRKMNEKYLKLSNLSFAKILKTSVT